MGWMYQATWPTPCSRVHKADLLEILCNLTKEHKGLLTICLSAKRSGLETSLRGLARGSFAKNLSSPKNQGVSAPVIHVQAYLWHEYCLVYFLINRVDNFL